MGVAILLMSVALVLAFFIGYTFARTVEERLDARSDKQDDRIEKVEDRLKDLEEDRSEINALVQRLSSLEAREKDRSRKARDQDL